MRILFYQHQYPAFGGIETVTTLLANRFAQDGHAVKIVSFLAKDGTSLLSKLHEGVRWERLPEEFPDATRNQGRLQQILAEFVPDYIIFQDSYAPIDGLLFSVVRGRVPVCVVEHSMPRVAFECSINFGSMRSFIKSSVIRLMSPYFRRKRAAVVRGRRRMLYQAATKYIFLSDRYIDMSNKIAGVFDCDKLEVIPNPVKPRCTDPVLADKIQEVLFCGSLIRCKGVDRLIEIWSAIEAIHPEWLFRIVGDGPLRGVLEKKVMALGLRNVRFEGGRTDVECYYHRAAILLMASDFEGWPMVIGEAMQQGCVPVVYDSFAAVNDMIDSGVNGIVVSHFNKKSYVFNLNRLMSDPQLLMRMQNSAIRKAESFRIDAIAKRWYRLLLPFKGVI